MAFISEGFIFIFLIFLCFIPTPFYLYKKMSLYYTPMNRYVYEQQIKERICTKCFKTVPWDSKICPYCGYKYENYL